MYDTYFRLFISDFVRICISQDGFEDDLPYGGGYPPELFYNLFESDEFVNKNAIDTRTVIGNRDQVTSKAKTHSGELEWMNKGDFGMAGTTTAISYPRQKSDLIFGVDTHIMFPRPQTTPSDSGTEKGT